MSSYFPFHRHKVLGIITMLLFSVSLGCREKPGEAILEGDALLGMGNLNGAIQAYSKAIEIAPDEASYYAKRGQIYFAQRKTSLAIADFSRAIELAPQDHALHFQRGEMHLKTGSYLKAIADLSQALEGSENLGQAQAYRGEAYLAQGSYQKSIADFDAALQSSDGDPLMYLNRGRAHAGQSQFYKAEQDFSSALDSMALVSDEDWAQTYWNRYLVRLKLKDKVLAEEDRLLAVQYDPSVEFSGTSIGRDMLKGLRGRNRNTTEISPLDIEVKRN